MPRCKKNRHIFSGALKPSSRGAWSRRKHFVLLLLSRLAASLGRANKVELASPYGIADNARPGFEIGARSSEMSMNQPKSKSRDEIAEAYSSPPWWYDLRGFFILTFAYNSTLWNQIRFFGRNFGPNHLEVACGTGTLLEMILKWRRWKRAAASRVTGVDYAESMLAGARRRFAGDSSVEVKHADAAAMPFEDNVFDSANIANAVHCLPDVDGALNDVRRVLKPGAVLALNVLLYPRTVEPFRSIAERINVWGMKKGILYTPYERDDIRGRILAAGFEIESEEISGNCYNVQVRKPAR